MHGAFGRVRGKIASLQTQATCLYKHFFRENQFVVEQFIVHYVSLERITI